MLLFLHVCFGARSEQKASNEGKKILKRPRATLRMTSTLLSQNFASANHPTSYAG